MPLLSQEQIAKELQTLKGWNLVNKEITKTYEHKDFVRAMGFVNSVALLAEKADHHPDIDIRWNKVTLTLSTHSAGDLTEKDFNLAQADAAKGRRLTPVPAQIKKQLLRVVIHRFPEIPDIKNRRQTVRRKFCVMSHGTDFISAAVLHSEAHLRNPELEQLFH